MYQREVPRAVCKIVANQPNSILVQIPDAIALFYRMYARVVSELEDRLSTKRMLPWSTVGGNLAADSSASFSDNACLHPFYLLYLQRFIQDVTAIKYNNVD